MRVGRVREGRPLRQANGIPSRPRYKPVTWDRSRALPENFVAANQRQQPRFVVGCRIAVGINLVEVDAVRVCKLQ